MLTREQIKAARAMLDWSQKVLAEKCDGVSEPTIKLIETGKINSTPETLGAIQKTFEDAGIEFIHGGIRKKVKLVKIYEGDDCYLKLLDDAYLSLSKTQGEILMSGADERRSTSAVIEKTRLLRKAGVKMRFLIRNGDTYFMGKPDEYRWMDDSIYVEGDVKVIFDDNVAYLMTWRNTPRVVVIQDKTIAEESRRIFDYMWDHFQPPSEKSSAENFYEDAA